jgi:hypothetical protein
VALAICLVAVVGVGLQAGGVIDVRDLWDSSSERPASTEGIPPEAESSYLRGVQYMESSSYSEALDCFELALQTYAGYSDAWSEKGEALQGLGKEEEALACFQTAVQVDPQNWVAWTCEGDIMGSIGRYQLAISCYNKVLKSEVHNRGVVQKAAQKKKEITDRGVPDNSDPPPTKEYDDHHPLQVKGGTNGYKTIHVREGGQFQTVFTVEGGQAPYYWFAVNGGGVADSISFQPNSGGALLFGTGAVIADPTTAWRLGQVELRVEDSSRPTRWRTVKFTVIVDSDTDDQLGTEITATDITATDITATDITSMRSDLPLAELEQLRQQYAQIIAMYNSSDAQTRAFWDSLMASVVPQALQQMYGSMSATDRATVDETIRRLTEYDTYPEFVQAASTVPAFVHVMDVLISAIESM